MEPYLEFPHYCAYAVYTHTHKQLARGVVVYTAKNVRVKAIAHKKT